MKAQMFIITMVFLVGLVFAVQSILSQYAFLDVAKVFETNDLTLLLSTKKSFQATLQSSPTCQHAGTSLQELENFLEKKVVGGSTIDITYTLDCSLWGSSPLNLTIHLKSIETDTLETAILSH